MTKNSIRTALCGTLLCASALATTSAFGQSAVVVDPQPNPSTDAAKTPGSRQVYDAAYFASYVPATALQMVERVPGFAIETIDPTVRGFGQTAGNVVINGQRPSAKSETLQTILARIPANRVARIEIGPGDQFGSDFSGKAQVLNLVLNASGGLAGTMEASALRDFTGKVRPAGSASALLKRGPSTFNASVTLANATTTEEGTDRIVLLPGQTEREFRRKLNTIDDPNLALAGSWEYDGGTNRTAHLNGRMSIDRFRLTQRNDVFPAVGPQRDDRLLQRWYKDEYEVGGDVTRPLAGGGLKVIGLARRSNRDNSDILYNRIDSNVIDGFKQTLNDSLQETLARIVWSRGNVGGWTVETGAEGVLNRLDSNVDLFSFDATGGQTRIDLPVDQALVKEVRGEAFFNAGKPLSSTLRLDLGVTQEVSRLTVTGDAKAERSLSFLKPKITLDWKPTPKLRAQLTVQRTVAQLQFEDFVSGAELANERVNGGNPDLLPQRAWEALATVERRILGDGLYKLELGYNQVSKVQDRIPTPEGFDAPGNLGNGHMLIVRNRIDAPLGKFGIKGGRLTLYGSYVSTSVVDPYTFRSRPFSGTALFFGEATFRQDLNKIAWGFTVGGQTSSTFYRRDETDRSFQNGPSASAFVEWRPDGRTSLNFMIDNLISTSGGRERTFYAPDRSSLTAFQSEARVRNRHVVPSLTFKRSFG